MWVARAEAVEANGPAADDAVDFLYQDGVTSWCEVVGVAREFIDDFCDAEYASLEEECRAGTGRSGCSQCREQTRCTEKKRIG